MRLRNIKYTIMDTQLSLKLQRNYAESCFECNNPLEGVFAFEAYLESLEKCIKQNSDNLKYVEEKESTLKYYKDVLLDVAKKSFCDRNWLFCAKCCNLLFKYDVNDAELYQNASFCYKNLKRYDLALDLLKIYRDKNPQDPSLAVCFGDLCSLLNTNESAYQAIDYYKQHLEKYPNDVNAYCAIAEIYQNVINIDKPNFNEQLYYINKALEYRPDDKRALRNMSHVLQRKGPREEEEASYQKYYNLFRNRFNHDDYFEYSARLISAGHFQRGWSYIDHRFEKESNPTYFPKINAKKWDGLSNIKKQILLLYCEQGFGDMIMMIRFGKYMKKLAKDIIVVVQDELVQLFRESKLGFEIYGRTTPLDRLKFDTYLPMFSLPRAYGITAENVPDTEGYLSINPNRARLFKKDFVSDKKFNIGISFIGAKQSIIERRDIDWKYLKILSDIENVQLYCLNKELTEEKIKEIDPTINIICLGEKFKDFADTAAAIKSMDLIVSTDNVIMNLAGSLGVKTFAVFNYTRNYRWYGTEDGKNVWYDSVIPFQAKEYMGWAEVLYRVKDEIKKLVNMAN